LKKFKETENDSERDVKNGYIWKKKEKKKKRGMV
jgi:hypothetical protein